MTIWFGVGFIYNAITLLFPTILSQIFNPGSGSAQNDGFYYLYLLGIAVIEILSYLISPFFMNHPKIGRKRTLLYGYVIIFVGSGMIVIFGSDNLAVLSICMVFIKISNTVTEAVLLILLRPRMFIQLNCTKL